MFLFGPLLKNGLDNPLLVFDYINYNYNFFFDK